MVATFDFFIRYSDAEIVRRVEALDADLRVYEKGEVVICEGDPVRRVALVLDGALHGCVEMPDGSRSVLNTLSRGYLAGGMLLVVPQERHLCTLVAVDRCELVTFSVARLLDWRREASSADFMQAVNAQQFRFSLEMTRKCLILSQASVERRILAYLGMRCRQEGSQTITVAGTEADFASYLGAHVVTVSRAMNRLKAAGKIDYRRNVITLRGGAVG